MDSWHAEATGWTVPGQGGSVGCTGNKRLLAELRREHKSIVPLWFSSFKLGTRPPATFPTGPRTASSIAWDMQGGRGPASHGGGTLVLATLAPPSQLCSIVTPMSRSICMRAQRPPTTQAADAGPTGWWPDISLWELKVSGVSETLVFSLGLARSP